MNSDTGIWVVLKREFRRILGSKICIWGLIVAPLLSFGILAYMMSEGLPQKIPVAVVDLDNSVTSRSLTRQLDAFPKTDIKFKSLSFKEARIAMERGQIYGIFYIPRDFTKDALAGDRPKLVFYTNNSFLISGSFLFQDMKTVSVLASASVGLKMGEARGFTRGQLMPVLQPISIDTHPLGNPTMNYSVYLNNVLIPGILFLVVMLFTISAFGSEVKSSTGKYVYELAGSSTPKLILGKLLPYTIISLILALFLMSVMYGYLEFPLHSGFMPMFVDYLLLILSAQAFGVILLGVFPNYRFALSAASLIGMMSFSLSGFSFPVSAMNPMLQSLSNLFPLRHFFKIYTDQALNGFDWIYSINNYAALLGFVFVGILLMWRVSSFVRSGIYKE